jgi:biopolymer transport protein ExbD
MKLRRKKRREGVVDVSSFSDVAFLLIIFFILTTTFKVMGGQELNIPSGEDGESKDQKQLTITLSGTKIFYGEKSDTSLTLRQLRAQLADEELSKKKEDQRMVVLESNDDVVYQRYYNVMLEIRDAGGIVALIERDSDE